jgi:hypothetical protein
MSTFRRARRPEARTAAGRLHTGAWLGITAGVVGLLLPAVIVLVAAYGPAGLLPFEEPVLQATGVLALGAALLFALSLLFYRSGFAALRPLDPRLWIATALCLIGTLGLLLVLAGIALTLTSSGALSTCLSGAPSHLPSCLESQVPSAALLGGSGFGLAIFGDLGIVVGLGLAGRWFDSRGIYGGAAAYAILLVLLAGPALVFVDPVASLSYPLLAAPLMVLLAPALVASGTPPVG